MEFDEKGGVGKIFYIFHKSITLFLRYIYMKTCSIDFMLAKDILE
jgi:hypothetical protein